jgi:hypothetical protein
MAMVPAELTPSSVTTVANGNHGGGAGGAPGATTEKGAREQATERSMSIASRSAAAA